MSERAIQAVTDLQTVRARLLADAEMLIVIRDGNCAAMKRLGASAPLCELVEESLNATIDSTLAMVETVGSVSAYLEAEPQEAAG